MKANQTMMVVSLLGIYFVAKAERSNVWNTMYAQQYRGTERFIKEKEGERKKHGLKVVLDEEIANEQKKKNDIRILNVN